MMKLLILFGALFVQITYAAVSHENEQVWRVYGSVDKKPEINALVDQYNIDVWSSTTNSIDIMISPKISSAIHSRLRRLDLSYNVMIEDIQTIIDSQQIIRENREKKVQPTATIDLETYHDLDEIYTYIDEIAAEFDYITSEVIGQTVEGRDMKVLRLATQPNNPNAIWIQCGIHAREWVAPATCLYGLDYLTSNYGQYANVTAFLDSQDVYMLTVANPDGYSYSWTNDRMWRKNRYDNANVEDATCVGVDLNRNYDDGVSWERSSNWTCSQSYQGVAGFSEPETTAIRNKVYSIQETQSVKTFLDMHSYSNLWIFAYGYKTDQPPHYDTMNEAAAAAAAAVLPLYGTVIEHGSSSVVLYEAVGTSKDWGYAYGIVYSYTVELRDDGEYGFLLPENQIIPNCIEAWAAIFASDGVMEV